MQLPATGTEPGSPTGLGAASRPGVRHRLRGPLLAAAGVGAAVGLLAVRDPHHPGAYGWCPYLLLTGHPCPLCGGLRAVNDLVRGDPAAAWHSNALVTLALPVAALLWAVWLRRRWRGSGTELPPLPGPRGGLALALLLFGFGLVRLLPGGVALLGP